MINPILIGGKIYLRPLERSDAPLFVKWINDPDVQKTILRAFPVNLQDEEEYVDRMRQSPNDVSLMIVTKSADCPLGTVALHEIDWRSRHATFGIVIGETGEWGKGYGSEATQLMVDYGFATLNLHRIWLIVLEHHQSAIRCYQKAGFIKEGLLREEYFREGRYWDSWLMAILRPDWEALAKSRQV